MTEVEILADGTDQTMVAALFSKIGGAVRSVDGRSSWVPSLTGLAGVNGVTGLCASPAAPLRLDLAMEVAPRALYTTIDGGASWNEAARW